MLVIFEAEIGELPNAHKRHCLRHRRHKECRHQRRPSLQPERQNRHCLRHLHGHRWADWKSTKQRDCCPLAAVTACSKVPSPLLPKQRRVVVAAGRTTRARAPLGHLSRATLPV